MEHETGDQTDKISTSSELSSSADDNRPVIDQEHYTQSVQPSAPQTLARQPSDESSSNDEPTDGVCSINDDGPYNQLRSIKAFTEAQLLSLHPEVGTISSQLQQQPPDALIMDSVLYELLCELEKHIDSLNDTRNQIRLLQKEITENRRNVWEFQKKSLRKIAMCIHGRIAESTLKYKQVSLSQRELDGLRERLSKFRDVVQGDLIYYSFNVQIKRYQILSKLDASIQNADRESLKSFIAALFCFIRRLNNGDSDFASQCRTWIKYLTKNFLHKANTEDYLFIVTLLTRGPPGISKWTANLIHCPLFERTNQYDSAAIYIDHCLALLNKLLAAPNQSEGQEGEISKNSARSKDASKQPSEINETTKWLYIDTDFEHDGEEFDINSSTSCRLSEVDIISFCQQVPVTKILKEFSLSSLNSANYNPEESVDNSMLKIVAIATKVIQTYQTGLKSYNSIRFNNLIEYLSSQIRHTVLVVSNHWQESKRRLVDIDSPMLMRLEVEYDHFILRSIITILELRRSGIWRYLADNSPQTASTKDRINQTQSESEPPAETNTTRLSSFLKSASVFVAGDAVGPATGADSSFEKVTKGSRSPKSLTFGFSVEWFHGVSDSMMWHILWQFHNNCRDEKKGEFNKMCKYYNDAYWRKKFQEQAVSYLFTEKFLKLPAHECNYLLKSMANMVLSRSDSQSDFVTWVVSEIFDFSFKSSALKSKVTATGIELLALCAEKYPGLISCFIKSLRGHDINDQIVELFIRCPLNGWMCDQIEFETLSDWIKEYPLTTVYNKVARLVLTKILLNDDNRAHYMRNYSQRPSTSCETMPPPCVPNENEMTHSTTITLKLSRSICLLLIEAIDRHFPSTNELSSQSLGASVEVCLAAMLDEPITSKLINIAISTIYSEFYSWCWRLLLTLRVHILDQSGTDWNAVLTRSGTSRSALNTVIVNDRFHPVPTIIDTECLLLASNIEKSKPASLYVYMMLTDVMWQKQELNNCMRHLNSLVNTGHVTPSLKAAEYLYVCHIEDLDTVIAKNPKTIQFWYTLITSPTSGVTAAQLASYIQCQMMQLTQFKQLQLMRGYTKILIEVTAQILRQTSSLWFDNWSHCLDKIACLFDHMVRFNFPVQRQQFIRILCDVSYSIQNWKFPPTGWLSTLISSGTYANSASRKEFVTLLHVLTQRNQNLVWLHWAVVECDTIRLEKIWEDIVTNLSSMPEATIESSIRKVCPQYNQQLIRDSLPINSWIALALEINEIDVGHELSPLIWYNFFLNYFANSLNGSSVGLKIVPADIIQQLKCRLDALFNYHYRQWTIRGSSDSHSQLAKLYKAFMLWLQDKTLQDAYVDLEHLGPNYLVPLLKSIMASSDSAWLPYVDLQKIQDKNTSMSASWSQINFLQCLNQNTSTRELTILNRQFDEVSMAEANDRLDDALSLNRTDQSHDNHILALEDVNTLLSNEDVSKSLEALRHQTNGSEHTINVKHAIELIKHHFHTVITESKYFAHRISKMTSLSDELIELIANLYSNTKAVHVHTVPCAENSACSGPAKIKFEVEEATMTEPVNSRIEANQQSFESISGELIDLPSRSLSIMDHVDHLPPLALFVLVSKFDITQWLRSATDELHSGMTQTVCAVLRKLGKRPDYEYLPSFELYRRHLQAAMSYKFPAEMLTVMKEFLIAMDAQFLAPDLWMDYLLALGFYASLDWPSVISASSYHLNDSTNRLERSTIVPDSLIGELYKLANSRKTRIGLDWHQLNDSIKLITEFFTNVVATRTDIVLLEQYGDYTKQFILVLASFTFMWIEATSVAYPNNQDLIWQQTFDLWKDWIFLDKCFKSIHKDDFEFVWTLYVACIQFLIENIDDSMNRVLSLIWCTFCAFIEKTRAIIYLEMSIMQRCIRQLPWNKFVMKFDDFKCLADIVHQERYNVADITSHIMLNMNWRDSIAQLGTNELSEVMEYAATSIILTASHLKGFRIPYQLHLVSCAQAENLARITVKQMEFVNLEFSPTNKLLINTLRAICLNLTNDSTLSQPSSLPSTPHSQTNDRKYRKHLIYANFISTYMTDLLTNQPSIISSHNSYVRNLIEGSLSDLGWLLLSSSIDFDQKTHLLAKLLDCCNTLTNDEARALISQSFVESSLFKQNPVIVIETIRAIGSIITYPVTMVYMLEHLIELYFSLNGHYEQLWKTYKMKYVTDTDILDACIGGRAVLTLLVHFEACMDDRTDEKLALCTELIKWVTQFNASPALESKVVVAWLRIATLLFNNVQQYKRSSLASSKHGSGRSHPIIGATLSLCNHLIELFDAHKTSVIWSLLRTSKEQLSPTVSIVALSLACCIAYRLINIESLYDNNEHSLQSEVQNLKKQCLYKLESAHKSRYFVEHRALIESILAIVNDNDKVNYNESIQLMGSYVTSFYAQHNYVAKILAPGNENYN
ncbi:Ectopic P granules protein 5-like protein, partial [Fragariocoptes setiger]